MDKDFGFVFSFEKRDTKNDYYNLMIKTQEYTNDSSLYSKVYNKIAYCFLNKKNLIDLIKVILDELTFKEIQEIMQEKKQSKKTISDYCKEAHETAKEKGFYDEKPNIPTLLMLIVSELSEAMEADREENFNLLNKGDLIYTNFQEEIADTFIRLFDLCGYLNIDIEKVIKMKMEKNKERPRKHGKRY